jgi:hypothetical protein
MDFQRATQPDRRFPEFPLPVRSRNSFAFLCSEKLPRILELRYLALLRDTSNAGRMTVSTRTLTSQSAALFCASVAANLVLALPNGVAFFFPFFIIQLVIIVFGVWAVLRFLQTPKISGSEFIYTFNSVPKWLLAASAITVAVAVFSALSINLDMGTLPDGTQVHRRSWGEKNGRYWMSVNMGPAIEISMAQYQKFQRSIYAIFATVWLVVSYLILILCYYVSRREGADANAADPLRPRGSD